MRPSNEVWNQCFGATHKHVYIKTRKRQRNTSDFSCTAPPLVVSQCYTEHDGNKLGITEPIVTFWAAAVRVESLYMKSRHTHVGQYK